MRRRTKAAHFRTDAEVLPGDYRVVNMKIDAGRPPWVTFRIKGSRTKFVMTLSEFVTLGLRKAQVRYSEAKLGTAAPVPITLDGFVKRAMEDVIEERMGR